MSRQSVPTDPGIAILLIPTAREYAAVAGVLGVAPEGPAWAALSACGPSLALAMCGIGKANAAGAAGALLGCPNRPRALINLGVAGALPGSPARLAQVVLASGSVFLDEGVQSDASFLTCEQLGFPLGPLGGQVAPDAGLATCLRPLADHEGEIATISTCAGTDDLARRRAKEGAIAEAMEGAAAGLVAWRLGVPFAELRVISNTTGSRDRQVWDLEGALERLGELAGQVVAAVGQV